MWPQSIADAIGKLPVANFLWKQPWTPSDESWCPKHCEALGLRTGSKVDISRYGSGLQLVPVGRTATLAEESGVLVLASETEIDDDDVFGLIDSGRR